MWFWCYFSLRYAAKMVLELLGWFSAFVLRYVSIQRELCGLPSFERHSLVFINRMLKSDFFLYFSGFFSYSLPNSFSLFLACLQKHWSNPWCFLFLSAHYQCNLTRIWNHSPRSTLFLYYSISGLCVPRSSTGSTWYCDLSQFRMFRTLPCFPEIAHAK